MTDVLHDLSTAVFSKTVVGQQEIQTRSLNLAPMVRRLLVLVDGRRNAKDLATFVTGNDIKALLSQLLEQGCIEAQAQVEPVPATNSKAAPDVAPDGKSTLSGLPAAETRSTKDTEMARNFMTNTVNTVFGQNTRLSLLEALLACKTTEDLRRVYPSWVDTLSASRIGVKRLPELRDKLFVVL